MTEVFVLSDVVADQVFKIRKESRLTREELADRCQALGWRISAAALANIETGRRSADGRRRREVTVDELVVLGHALGVPPVLLIYPVGQSEQSDYLPDRSSDTWTAYRLLVGDLTLVRQQDDAPGRLGVSIRSRVLDAYQRHTVAVADYVRFRDDEPARARDALKELLRVREEIRAARWLMPGVPFDIEDEVTRFEDGLRVRLSVQAFDSAPARDTATAVVTPARVEEDR